MAEESKSITSKLKRLSSVEVPAEETRYSTKIAGLDACLAESEDGAQGLPAGTSILLSGMPGGGKSTIATYMAAMNTGRDSIIFHGEERAERVKARWNRLNITDADPYVVPLRAMEDALDTVRELNSAEDGKGVGVGVLDSIQTVTLNGRRKYQDQYEAAEMFVGQVCSSGGCAILVSHVDKSGQAHQGSAALAHLVDIHIHVDANAKKSERKLQIRKNRMGRAGFEVPLNITINGLSVGVPAPLNPSSGMGQARTALEKACETAYALLMNGERLDGYDFDKANVSGGLWRAGLEMAAKRAVRDGFEVVEEKIKGRKGWRLLNPPPKAEDGNIVVVTNVLKVDKATGELKSAELQPKHSLEEVKADLKAIADGVVKYLDGEAKAVDEIIGTVSDLPDLSKNDPDSLIELY